VSAKLRAFLGTYAGKLPGQADEAASAAIPTGGLVNISSIMQPIKIGTGFGAIGLPKGKKAEEGFAAQGSRKSLFGDEDDVDPGQDTVLLSRSESFPYMHAGLLTSAAKGAHIVPPTSGSRKVKTGCIRLFLSTWNVCSHFGS
jgi:hypothetical protein